MVDLTESQSVTSAVAPSLPHLTQIPEEATDPTSQWEVWQGHIIRQTYGMGDIVTISIKYSLSISHGMEQSFGCYHVFGTLGT